MRNSILFASALAVASTAVTAQSATAATSDASLKAGLRQAICSQDWDGAIRLSSVLIASTNITPEYRQNLVDWRNRFTQYSRAKTSFSNIPDCEGIPIRVKAYEGPAPRFSAATVGTGPVCYMDMHGVRRNLSHLCQENSAPAETVVAASNRFSRVSAASLADVRVARASFDNEEWSRLALDYVPTNTLRGQVWNSGNDTATNVRVKIVGMAEGANPQTQYVVVPRIGPGQFVEVETSFNFSSTLDSWEVTIESFQ